MDKRVSIAKCNGASKTQWCRISLGGGNSGRAVSPISRRRSRLLSNQGVSG